MEDVLLFWIFLRMVKLRPWLHKHSTKTFEIFLRRVKTQKSGSSQLTTICLFTFSGEKLSFGEKMTRKKFRDQYGAFWELFHAYKNNQYFCFKLISHSLSGRFWNNFAFGTFFTTFSVKCWTKKLLLQKLFLRLDALCNMLFLCLSDVNDCVSYVKQSRETLNANGICLKKFLKFSLVPFESNLNKLANFYKNLKNNLNWINAADKINHEILRRVAENPKKYSVGTLDSGWTSETTQNLLTLGISFSSNPLV